MLTEPKSLSRHLLGACLLVLLFPGLSAHAQEGQYRSKVRVDNSGDVGEGAGLSIEELERQISSIQDSYARSSAGRHLARHYVEAGEYDKAIEYYQTALAAGGLSDIANREMLRELAQVYLISKNYADAANTLERVLRIKLVPEAGDYLLLAQAYYRLGRLAQVVGALDPIREKGLVLDITQQRQALALYYQAGAYPQCELLLRQLLNVEPDNPENWHQLSAVYLQQGKKKEALDQLTLAREKAVPFREQDTVLLADLQAVNGNPYGAAVILDSALSNKGVQANGLNYRKLFQFWLQAREKEKASAALVQAARLSGDIELYLYLAQLQMEQEAWRPMYQTMQAACRNQLPGKYVSRSNLLLGISQLKLGDKASARRSFINATLIGGAGAEAGKWLEFMQADPPTARESRGIVGVCHGPGDKQVSADAFAGHEGDAAGSLATAASVATAADSQPGAAVATKTVPKLRFFYQEYHQPLAQLAGEAKSLALPMGIALVRGGGTVDGPLQIIARGEGEGAALELGFPFRGSPRALGKYKTLVAGEFKCAYLVHEGKGDTLAAQWATFLADVERAGYKLTPQRRLLLQAGGGGGTVRLELQVGIE
jgi:tetratricopeptide (TPR) repeat protein